MLPSTLQQRGLSVLHRDLELAVLEARVQVLRVLLLLQVEAPPWLLLQCPL